MLGLAGSGLRDYSTTSTVTVESSGSTVMVVNTLVNVLFRGDLQTTLLRYFFRLRSVDLGASAAAAPSDALSPGLELNLSLQVKRSDGPI